MPQKLRRRRDSTGEIMEACGSRRKKGGQNAGARTVAYAAAPSLLGNSERLHPHDQEPRLGAREREERDEVPNPLTVFPRRTDRMTTVFWQEPKRQVRQFWLSPLVAHNPAALDAIMKSEGGASGPQDSAKREAARWFRGAAAKELLGGDAVPGVFAKAPAPPSGGGGGGGGGAGARRSSLGGTSEEFVMVPKGRLGELCEIEKLLQEERKALGEQCTWLLSDTQISTRTPQPYVVAAVNYICDLEVETAGAAIQKLRAWRWRSLRECIAEWEASRSTLGYLNLTGYTPKEHAELMPLAERPAVHKGALVKFFKGRWMAWQQEELEQEERERQTMVREEAAQRQVLRCHEAQERKADYGIYAALATSFGPLAADLFEQQNRCGAAYQDVVSEAVLVLERFWLFFFPFRVARKRGAARDLQRLWRAHVWRVRIKPIFAFRDRLRSKMVRRHLQAWQVVASKSTRARVFLLRLFKEHEQWALAIWRDAARAQKKERLRKLELIARQFQNRHMFAMFRSWSAFTYKMLRVKFFCKRIMIDNEHHVFRMWADNVANISWQRFCIASALHGQRAFRGYLGRRFYKRIKAEKAVGCLQFQRIFRGFRGRCRANEAFRGPMLQRLREHFWARQKEAEQRALRKDVKEEEARLARETLLLGLAEADALARDNASRGLLGASLSKDRKARLLASTRALARHEFRRAHPPKIAHANSLQSVTFVCNEHYVKHCEADPECPKNTPQLHLLLLRGDGWPLFERFLLHQGGVTAVRDLMFWLQCQALRKQQANTLSFQVTAEQICTRFVAVEPEVRVHVPQAEAERIIKLVGKGGAGRGGKRGKGAPRGGGGGGGPEDGGGGAAAAAGDAPNCAPPSVFWAAEWHVLHYMLGKWHHDFVESAEGDAYRALLASEARRREGLEVAFFKRRKALMLQDARAVRALLRLNIIWKRQAVALVWLRRMAKTASWHHNRRCKAWDVLRHRGQQALAKFYLLERVAIARWHIDRQAKALKVLRKASRKALVHCARQDGAQLALHHAVAHQRRQQDCLALLQCRAALSEIVTAASFAGVLYHRQLRAIKWLRARAVRAKAHSLRQDICHEFLVAWGCRVLGHSTPGELRAAATIQRLARIRLARKAYRVLLNAVIDKVFDMSTGRYYFVNKRTGEVQWQTPVGMGSEPMLTPRSFRSAQTQLNKDRVEFARERAKAQRQARGGYTADEAALVIQRASRTSLARRHFKQMINGTLEKIFDEQTGLWCVAAAAAAAAAAVFFLPSPTHQNTLPARLPPTPRLLSQVLQQQENRGGDVGQACGAG